MLNALLILFAIPVLASFVSFKFTYLASKPIFAFSAKSRVEVAARVYELNVSCAPKYQASSLTKSKSP